MTSIYLDSVEFRHYKGSLPYLLKSESFSLIDSVCEVLDSMKHERLINKNFTQRPDNTPLNYSRSGDTLFVNILHVPNFGRYQFGRIYARGDSIFLTLAGDTYKKTQPIAEKYVARLRYHEIKFEIIGNPKVDYVIFFRDPDSGDLDVNNLPFYSKCFPHALVQVSACEDAKDLPSGEKSNEASLDFRTLGREVLDAAAPWTPTWEALKSGYNLVAGKLNNDDEQLKDGAVDAGLAVITSYAARFTELYPALRKFVGKGMMEIHHRIPQMYIRSGLFPESMMTSLSNLQGLPKRIHQTIVTPAWNEFARLYPNATRAQIMKFAIEMDKKIAPYINKIGR
jgi:hypothetical protein